MDECTLTKSCLVFPTGCKQTRNCDAIVTWRADTSQNVIRFEIGGKRGIPNKWFAVGMSNDEVMVCCFHFCIKYFLLPDCLI